MTVETEIALIKQGLANLEEVARELKDVRPALSKRIYELEGKMTQALDNAVETINKDFMTRREAKPVWMLVYGLVAIICTTAIGGLLSLLWKGGK